MRWSGRGPQEVVVIMARWIETLRDFVEALNEADMVGYIPKGVRVWLEPVLRPDQDDDAIAVYAAAICTKRDIAIQDREAVDAIVLSTFRLGRKSYLARMIRNTVRNVYESKKDQQSRSR